MVFSFCVGVLTVFLARTAALLQEDAKKVVALSTLRQLGLLFLSLRVGNVFLCLFHVLTHAFSKANLFLIVGKILYSSFREQNLRVISSGTRRMFVFISSLIRILSLSGLV